MTKFHFKDFYLYRRVCIFRPQRSVRTEPQRVTNSNNNNLAWCALRFAVLKWQWLLVDSWNKAFILTWRSPWLWMDLQNYAVFANAKASWEMNGHDIPDSFKILSFLKSQLYTHLRHSFSMHATKGMGVPKMHAQYLNEWNNNDVELRRARGS